MPGVPPTPAFADVTLDVAPIAVGTEFGRIHRLAYPDPLGFDLTGDGPVRMGIPSDVVRGSRQRLARKWSVAFHDHPAGIDGVLYPSVSGAQPP